MKKKNHSKTFIVDVAPIWLRLIMAFKEVALNFKIRVAISDAPSLLPVVFVDALVLRSL